MNKLFFRLLAAILMTAPVIPFSHSLAQGVAINGQNLQADSSAMLDISSPDKGILVPRVSNLSSVQSPATGLLVMLVNASNDTSFYYNNGTPALPDWRQLVPNPANKELDVNNFKITNLATCTANLDAANKEYVDNAIAALTPGGGPSVPSMLSPLSPQKYTLSQAVDYCSNLAYNGYSDWRLPVFEEIAYFFGSTSATDTLWTLSLTPNQYYPTNQNYISVRLNDGKWFNGGVSIFWPYSQKSVSGNTTATSWTTVCTLQPMPPGDAMILNAISLNGSVSPSYSSYYVYLRLVFNYVDGTRIYSQTYNTNNSNVYNNLTNIPVVDGITPLSSIDVEMYVTSGGTGYATLNATYYDYIFHQKDGRTNYCRCVR